MHSTIASLLGLAISMALALPGVSPLLKTEESIIPSSVLYYYRYNSIPLSLYGNQLMTESHRETEAMVSNLILNMTCNPAENRLCPPGPWYCDSERGKCTVRAVLGDMCTSDDACFSGNCRSRCSVLPGHYGASCTGDSQCDSGMVCRQGANSQGERRCLDRVEGMYGLSCTKHSDCESPLSCNEIDLGGMRRMCSVAEDLVRPMHLTGTMWCFKDGEFCGGDMQCCSGRCHRTMTSVIPRCMSSV
ncbi:hypothetical protein PDE_03698 [Penicillium oxalicum 114-2]|uniref:Dickkopf N-terminal cysteine-rich domain-containing protein n=1 Tax=Penicillium oxalicum (strain 114-2 / CGMCC 5302) TaxID=933388 RepID=S8B2S7_PENO1|nr:hypothetical protein PDE_03698 [Penicillium oxalicum 114-2]